MKLFFSKLSKDDMAHSELPNLNIFAFFGCSCQPVSNFPNGRDTPTLRIAENFLECKRGIILFPLCQKNF